MGIESLLLWNCSLPTKQPFSRTMKATQILFINYFIMKSNSWPRLERYRRLPLLNVMTKLSCFLWILYIDTHAVIQLYSTIYHCLHVFKEWEKENQWEREIEKELFDTLNWKLHRPNYLLCLLDSIECIICFSEIIQRSFQSQ